MRSWFTLPKLGGMALAVAAGVAWIGPFDAAQAADTGPSLEPGFEQVVRPFLQKNCVSCHNVDVATAGIKVDQLNANLEDRHLRLWEAIQHRVGDGTMPPKGLPRPKEEDRQKVMEWLARALDVARSRPTPKNGLTRRLTVSQYRNTLRELLRLEDDLTEILPPDAVSKDGFVNNKETLQLNPLLTESYFEIAEEALNRAIVDPKQKPVIQNFRLDLGAGINKNPIADKLILGANSMLLENDEFTVTELQPKKPFAYTPFAMRKNYRFIEGYQGNDTVRGWREYSSIYHSVFACMRGSRGYPKGLPYNLVPEGLLLRPAIPNDETFTADGTYGPKANFKISLRELPDYGRFRVTVVAAKYNDGLLLDPGVAIAAAGTPGQLTAKQPNTLQTLQVPRAGVYQVDVVAGQRADKPPAPDASRLGDGLAGDWSFNQPSPTNASAGALAGEAKLAPSPFGQGLVLSKDADSFTVARSEAIAVGSGEFTISAWIRPQSLRKSTIIARGAFDYLQGWNLEIADGRGVLRLDTAGPEGQPTGSIASPAGALKANVWQHVAAVVRRGSKEARLFVNGYAVAKGEIGGGSLDNNKLDLVIGKLGKSGTFRGELDEVKLYRRALDEAELQALVEPGRKFVAGPPPERTQEVTLTLGDRQFAGPLPQAPFLAVRLSAGPLAVVAKNSGLTPLDRLVFTPLAEPHPVAKSFAAFEKRQPRLGVHLGLRRDCGSTFSPVGGPQTVANSQLQRFTFEGAIRNFPSPDVEKDNVNYLAGIREIAVRSEYTDGRDMPRLLIKSVEFEGPFFESWPPPSHTNIFSSSTAASNPAIYAKQIIKDFASRAYRRPVSSQEEAALLAVYRKSQAEGASFPQSVKDALQVVLTSPQFLFLVERSNTPQPEQITDQELASKLSYFLWNGPPDQRLLQLAAKGTLRAQLRAEVDRMVADPRFSNFTKEFTSQWLNLEKFAVLEPDRGKFPKLTRDVRAQLRQEPIQFFEYLVRNNLPASNLIQSKFVLANEVVASYYDLKTKPDTGFRFIPILHERRELGGVLTQPALMAGLSDGRESNPVKRGAWVARKIVAEPPNDPPPNVPALKEESAGLTLRQRLEQHRNQPGCQQCHQQIDPWGVALEEFDAGGRLKAQKADARSVLPDKTEVEGIDGLRQYLSGPRMDQVAFSVLKHLAIYANGRSLAYNELNQLKKDTLQLKVKDYRMREMLHFVVNSKLFLEK